MGGERRQIPDDMGRESAAFDVSTEDYRRAFALAMASWPEPVPRYGLRLRYRLALDQRNTKLLILLVAGAAFASRFSVDFIAQTLAPALAFAVKAACVTFAGLVLIAVYGAWDDGRSRKRFPKERAAWKRPQRMRVRWDAAGLTLAGQEGFGNVAWRTLHAWLDAPGELVIFTAPYDPVPVPHAALGEGDLEDLRICLTGADVPRAWQPMSDADQRLKQVFR